MYFQRVATLKEFLNSCDEKDMIEEIEKGGELLALTYKRRLFDLTPYLYQTECSIESEDFYANFELNHTKLLVLSNDTAKLESPLQRDRHPSLTVFESYLNQIQAVPTSTPRRHTVMIRQMGQVDSKFIQK